MTDTTMRTTMIEGHCDEQSVSRTEENISGPEKLMLWLFLAWFVFFAMILLGGLIGSFFN